jgi:transposase
VRTWPPRAAWQTDDRGGVGGISPERLVFLDECGVLTNLARLWGRSPRGTRACGTVPCGHWTRLTVLGALGAGGIVAAMSVEAATSGAVFHAYLDRVLLPELRRTGPDAVLVLDNLGAHRTPAVRGLLDRSGFAYRYLPPYSPDLNPIEPAWAKVKADLRRAAVRTAEALQQAIGPALDSITAADAAASFQHCGYGRPGGPAVCSTSRAI